MTNVPDSNRWWRLGVPGWVYVAGIGALAVASELLNAIEFYLLLWLLTIPTGLLGMFASLELMSGLDRVLALDPDGSSWQLGVVWVVSWLASAWLNVKLAQLGWRSGRQWLVTRRDRGRAEASKARSRQDERPAAGAGP